MVKKWPVVKIGKCFEFKNGLNKGKSFFGYGIPIVNYMDVYRRNGIHASQLKGRVSLSKHEIRRFDVKKGDVFFTRTSETPEEVGYASVMLDNIGECVFSGFVLRARPTTDLFDINYCKYCFSTPDVRRSIMAGCTYTTRALTNGRQLSAIEIPLPEKDEQAAIAEALTDVDSLIISLEKLIAKKKAIKQGAMQGLLTGKRRLPGFSGEWCVAPLGRALSVGHGQSQNSVVDETGKYPILATGGIIGRTNQFIWNKPTVLIGRKGTIDKPQYMDTPFWTIDTLFYTKVNNGYHAKYLYYLFCMIDWLQYNEASGVPSLSANLIEKIEVELPDYQEQTAIAAILSDMDAELEQLEKKRAKYRLIKQGILQELLTGRIRLVEPTVQTKTAAKPKVVSTGHNKYYDDAIAISAIVNTFYNDKFPLGRVKVQKLLYLLRRKQHADVSAFKKKAAGPYNEAARYKGGEAIAFKNRYIVRQSSDRGSKFGRGANIDEALKYVGSMQSNIDWLYEKFKYYNTYKEKNNLEVLATVDVAVCELDKSGEEVSLDSIKEVIRSNKEWASKLKKDCFTDEAIRQAIVESRELFG